MWNKKISVAVVAIGLTGGAGFAAQAQTACPSGDLSIADLANAACTQLLPVPSARPADKAGVEAEPEKELTRADFDYLEAVDPKSGEMRSVRLVGARFLPDQESEASYRATMMGEESESGGGWRDSLYAAVSWFGVGAAQAETGEESARLDD